MTIRIFLISAVCLLFSICSHAEAGNWGAGVHSGYGTIKYEEDTSALGTEDESEADLETVLFGLSAEYSFARLRNFFSGVTTDWIWGLEDREEFKREDDDVTLTEDKDMSLFGQFYDVRFGYKNSLDRFYHRVYLSGGWDGIYFRRKNFVLNGSPLHTGVITEEFSLWRIGGGVGLGYNLGDKWAVDGRAAYSYYVDGEVKNSSHGGQVFDTNGTCFDAGIGIKREITHNMSLYAGGSYTLIDLDESGVNREITRQGNITIEKATVFPHSRTQIVTGIINVTYAF